MSWWVSIWIRFRDWNDEVIIRRWRKSNFCLHFFSISLCQINSAWLQFRSPGVTKSSKSMRWEIYAVDLVSVMRPKNWWRINGCKSYLKTLFDNKICFGVCVRLNAEIKKHILCGLSQSNLLLFIHVRTIFLENLRTFVRKNRKIPSNRCDEKIYQNCIFKCVSMLLGVLFFKIITTLEMLPKSYFQWDYLQICVIVSAPSFRLCPEYM